MKLKKKKKKKSRYRWISITEEVNESIMSIKNSIIGALKKENLKLPHKVTKLEEYWHL